MAVGSNVNPNYPIPGLDQTSKGFRDNFAIIKQELESLQGTSIKLIGGVTSNLVQIGSTENIVIETFIAGGSFSLNPPNHAIQYNKTGVLSGSNVFIFDDGNVTVGIGTTVVNPATSITTAKGAEIHEEITVLQDTPGRFANIRLKTSNLDAYFGNMDNHIQIGTDVSANVSVITGGEHRLTITNTGFVGIGTDSPIAQFQTFAINKQTIANFTTNKSFSDNIVRLKTTGNASTIGVGLDNSTSLGGLSISTVGDVRIHAGESSSAYLSTSSARLIVTPVGWVGIGVPIPGTALDVNGAIKTKSIFEILTPDSSYVGIKKLPAFDFDVEGDIGVSGGIITTSTGILIGTTPIEIDVWPTGLFRSARYTIQVVNGTAPSEHVNIIDAMVTHANGTAYLKIVDQLNSDVSLGTVTVGYNFDNVSIYYTGNAAGNKVKITKSYITI